MTPATLVADPEHKTRSLNTHLQSVFIHEDDNTPDIPDSPYPPIPPFNISPNAILKLLTTRPEQSLWIRLAPCLSPEVLRPYPCYYPKTHFHPITHLKHSTFRVETSPLFSRQVTEQTRLSHHLHVICIFLNICTNTSGATLTQHYYRLSTWFWS